MQSAFDAAFSVVLRDHSDLDVAAQPTLARLERGCRRAAQRQLEWQRSPTAEPATLFAKADPAASHWPRPEAAPSGGLSIAYLVMGHRAFAHATIARLLWALWDPAHFFLIHMDARANATMVEDVRRRFDAPRYSNVRVVEDSQRRPIGWGSFSMVDLLLHSIATVLAAAPAFDFFINLSDADVALRTNREIVGFLLGFRGRSFVATKFPKADSMRYNAHARMREPVSARGAANRTAECAFHFAAAPRLTPSHRLALALALSSPS